MPADADAIGVKRNDQKRKVSVLIDKAKPPVMPGDSQGLSFAVVKRGLQQGMSQRQRG
jgi:hypothetical protein